MRSSGTASKYVVSPVPSHTNNIYRRHDMTIVDAHDRVIVYLSRNSPAMDPVLTRVERQFETARDAYRFKPSQTDHRRGKYKAAAAGASYGGGQQVRPSKLDAICIANPRQHKRVGNLRDTTYNKQVIDRELLGNDDVIKLAGFVDGTQTPAHPNRCQAHKFLSRVPERSL